MRALLIFIGLLLFAVQLKASDKPRSAGHVADWKSERYTEQTIPIAWRAERTPKTVRSRDEFLAFFFPSSSIVDVTTRFGVPDHYLVRKKKAEWGQYNWLIYDLPDGYAAFYVTAPPNANYAAGIIIDLRGKLLKLIK